MLRVLFRIEEFTREIFNTKVPFLRLARNFEKTGLSLVGWRWRG